MEFQELLNSVLSSNSVFAVLFVYLFYNSRMDAQKREDKLYEQLEKQGVCLNSITLALEKIHEDIENIKRKVGE